MTVCVAGIYENRKIITACDGMVSFRYFSADNVMSKIYPVHPNWNVMVCGDDTSWSDPMIDSLSRLLGFVRGHTKPIKERSLKEVMVASEYVYSEERRAVATKKYLSPLKVGFDEFKKRGSKLYGQELYLKKLKQLDEWDMDDCELLVSGIDADMRPHVFTVDNPGIAHSKDSVGFWAIGSGQTLALSWLSFAEYKFSTGLPQCLYDICAAKFFAEKQREVGFSTLVLLHEFKKIAALVTSEQLDQIREIWDSDGSPKRPLSAEEAIQGMIFNTPLGS